MDKVPIIVQELRAYHDIKRIKVATRMLKDASPFFEYYLAFPFKMEDPEFRISAVNATAEPIIDQLPGTNTDAYTAQSGLTMFNDEFTIHWNNPDARLLRSRPSAFRPILHFLKSNTIFTAINYETTSYQPLSILCF